jgi:HK97 family phage portal protein
MLLELLGLDRGSRRESRATPENPSFSLNDPDAWDEVLGGSLETDAGISISPRGSLQVSAVWQAVSMISGDVAKLPLDVYQSGDDRQIDRKHSAWPLVRHRANREKSAFDFWRTIMVHALIWNNGYGYIDRDNSGRPLELFNLLPDRTQAERHNGALVYVTETMRPDGTPWLRAIPAADIIHVKGIAPDIIHGCSLVEKAKHSWALAVALQKFASKFFRNGTRAGGILEIPAAMTPKASQKLEEGFKKTDENSWFKTVILRDGAKFHQQTIAPNEGQMNESREQQVREVARWFNLAPSRLGLSDSVSYNSKSEDNQDYLDTTLSPWLCAIASECNMKLLAEAEQRDFSRYFEHNTFALLRMSGLQRYQMHAIGIRSRFLLPNDVRRIENMPPLEGGDEFPEAAPKSPGGADKGENDKPRGPADDTGGEADRTTGHAERRIRFGIGSRARHKAGKGHRAFLEWLDGNLVSHRTEAQQIGATESIVDDACRALRALVETVTVNELPAAVDRAMTEFESAA